MEQRQGIWARGAKAKLARLSGISPQHLNEILQRRSRVTTRQKADRLEQNARLLGMRIFWQDWMLPTETTNPYFAPKASESQGAA